STYVRFRPALGCHSFRATGITVYLTNGGLLEHAQQMAAHESARTTKLYDRRNERVTLDGVEKIMIARFLLQNRLIRCDCLPKGSFVTALIPLPIPSPGLALQVVDAL